MFNVFESVVKLVDVATKSVNEALFPNDDEDKKAPSAVLSNIDE